MFTPETSAIGHDSSLARVPAKACIISAKWHWEIVDATRIAAIDVLKKANSACEIHDVVCPGTLEIPQLVHHVLTRARSKPDVMIVLGCVIRGETAHFNLIVDTVFESINALAIRENTVITNGILTVENLAQAQDRAGGSKGNKGIEAAWAALELFSEMGKIK